MIIYGINPVIEALRAGRVRRIRVAARADKRIEEIFSLARDAGIRVDRVDVQSLERDARGGVHQGVVAELEPRPDYSVAELVAVAAPDAPLIVVSTASRIPTYRRRASSADGRAFTAWSGRRGMPRRSTAWR